MGIWYGLGKFYHYFFVREVGIIRDYKALLAIFKKYIATFPQRIQQILLRIHQYRVSFIYRPWPDLIHTRLAVQKKPQKKQKWRNARHVVKFPCNTINYKHTRMYDNTWTKGSNFSKWTPTVSYGVCHTRVPKSKTQPPQYIRTYWMFRDDMKIIDGVVIEGRSVVI